MANEETEKTSKTASKSFMAVGPTLHYSHKNVLRCWLLALAAFSLSCLFWSKIVVGTFLWFDPQAISSATLLRLGPVTMTGISIFEYPWQILVLGLLMGVLAVVPVLISQLMSIRYSVPFILAIVLLANLPVFAIFILVSCVAAACRPLRFRSRFTAIALCIAPQLVYWGCFGGARAADPIEWGFSFTPWICAWLIGLAIAGLVLGVGHFTRYRPGLVLAVTSVFLLLAIVTFEIRIGFDELDYQLYVAKNDPENVSEFYDYNITEVLDEQIKHPSLKLRRHLESGFYPDDAIQRREELKKEIQVQLSYDLWPWWFAVPPELQYQAKKKWLFEQYDCFIMRRAQSRRMPIALYYRALLNEYSVDVKLLGEKEVLHFYSDYPYESSLDTWSWLNTEFGDSPESIEARWRIAKHWAGRRMFEQADKLLAEAQKMIANRLKALDQAPSQEETLFSLFHPPADSVMTSFKLGELQVRVNGLRTLIGSQNRTGEAGTKERLAEFVLLNPYSENYAWQLSGLLEQMPKEAPLRDNVELAQAKLVADEQLRGEKFEQLHEKYKNTDGGTQALYRLGLLKIGWYKSESNPEQKKKRLAEARDVLTRFVKLYPDSFCAERVKRNLEGLPPAD